MASRYDQNYINAEFLSVYKTLSLKLGEILKDNKAQLLEDCRDLIQLLFRGANSDCLHESYKLNVVQFLKRVLSFSDVCSLQIGTGFKEKIALNLLVKLFYIKSCESDIIITDFKGKRFQQFLGQILKRVLNTNTDFFRNVVFQGITGYDINSSVPRNSILHLPFTLDFDDDSSSWSRIHSGELSAKLGQWLLLHCNQITVPAKKRLFGGKGSSNVVTSTEVDGSTSHDLFTILCMNQSYHAETLLNIYCFSVLKSWIRYLYNKREMVDCLSFQFTKPFTADTKVFSTTPLQIGGSKFYDEFSSGSDSAGASLSSSISSMHSFLLGDDMTDALDVRKGTDSPRSQTPFRKTSQMFDTKSITSDVLSASNLKSIVIRYCLRIFNQSERTPRNDMDRKLITASIVESISILDYLCHDDANTTQKVFTEIKRLYQRIEKKPFSAPRVFVALLEFFVHHHEGMMIQVDEILETYFTGITEYLANQTAAFELLTFCLNSKEFFKEKTTVLQKYFLNIFKMVAWWPCTFLNEICELLPVFLTISNAAEVFHSILDLPCLSALLCLQQQGILGDNERLQSALGLHIKPYYASMFLFILRDSSGGGETIDKLSELHSILGSLLNLPRVKYVCDIVPLLLECYFNAAKQLNEASFYQNVFPVLLERVYMLYSTGPHRDEIHQLLATQIPFITEKVPDIVSLYHEELLSFLCQVNAKKIVNKPLISNIVWCIGERGSYENCKPNQVASMYDAIEACVYEHSQEMGNEMEDILASVEVISSMLSAIAKLAAASQYLIPQAITCLSKISLIKHDQCKRLSYHDYLSVTTYADELMQILKKPKVAPAVFCNEKKLLPWHLDSNTSLLLKVHLLTENIDI